MHIHRQSFTIRLKYEGCNKIQFYKFELHATPNKGVVNLNHTTTATRQSNNDKSLTYIYIYKHLHLNTKVKAMKGCNNI